MKKLQIAPLEPSSPRSERIYDVLLEAILNGDIASGERLQVDMLAQHLGVSSTPVRDALGLLESKGLVTRYPYQGARVRVFDIQEIVDLYEVRVTLEVLAVVSACHRIAPSDLEHLSRVQAQAAQALERGEEAVYRKCNQEFHAAILRGTGNSLLQGAMQAISLQTQMMIAQTVKVAGRPEVANREHKELTELIGAGRAPEAKALIKQHIVAALHDILKTYEDEGGEPSEGRTGKERLRVLEYL